MHRLRIAAVRAETVGEGQGRRCIIAVIRRHLNLFAGAKKNRAAAGTTARLGVDAHADAAHQTPGGVWG